MAGIVNGMVVDRLGRCDSRGTADHLTSLEIQVTGTEALHNTDPDGSIPSAPQSRRQLPVYWL